jgi:hypothetical protein
MAEYLLRRGARTRLPDDPPWAAPLALAAHRGHAPIVELLTAYERTGALPRRDLAYYEGLVRDLLEACGSGDEGAMHRLTALFRSSSTWPSPMACSTMSNFSSSVFCASCSYSAKA